MKILIIGATSAIAIATARLYAERRDHLFLIARNAERLSDLAADLRVRGAQSVACKALNLDEVGAHAAVIAEAEAFLQHIDVALIAHGVLPHQTASATDYKHALNSITTNGLSVISLLTELAKRMQAQRSGTIAVITSVAGMRGRQPNYVYGAAKAMVSTYLQGLRGRLHEFNVHVVDIRPGLVDSPMTAQFPKALLWSRPEVVANKIVNSVARKQHTVYAPGYWRWILLFVIAIPEALFKRMKF